MSKALVVDDTKNIRNLLTTCLELYGFEVTSASNGEEALTLFNTDTFDLAFLDIKMPVFSGTEVLRRIRAMGINTPVVIMTAFATVRNAVECTKLGAVAYLQKPFTADKVKTVLDELKQNSIELPVKKDNLTISRELVEAGQIDDAFNLLKKSLSINPSDWECYYLIGKIHELKGNLEEAKKFFFIFEQFGKV